MATYDVGDQVPLPIASDESPTRVGNPNLRRRLEVQRLPSELTEAELLAGILGPTSSQSCEQLTKLHDGLRAIAMLSPADFIDLGFKPAAAERIAAIFEVAKRYGEQEFVPGQVYRCSADVYEQFRERLGIEVVEIFVAVLLDNKHRKLRDVMVSKGSLTASIVHPRDVFTQVVRHSAAAVVFVHNHPSGDPTPSREDLDITRRLRQVGDIMGVRVLDHIVIGRGRYVSFVDDGYW